MEKIAILSSGSLTYLSPLTPPPHPLLPILLPPTPSLHLPLFGSHSSPIFFPPPYIQTCSSLVAFHVHLHQKARFPLTALTTFPLEEKCEY